MSGVRALSEALGEAIALVVGAGNGVTTRSRPVEEWQRLYRVFSDARALVRSGALIESGEPASEPPLEEAVRALRDDATVPSSELIGWRHALDRVLALIAWTCDWQQDDLNPGPDCPYCAGQMCARFDGLGCTHNRIERHGYPASLPAPALSPEPEASAVPEPTDLRAMVDLIGDRDIYVQSPGGVTTRIRFGKGEPDVPLDSRTGMPLGHGHFATSESLGGFIERLNRIAPGMVSIYEGKPLAATPPGPTE